MSAYRLRRSWPTLFAVVSLILGAGINSRVDAQEQASSSAANANASGLAPAASDQKLESIPVGQDEKKKPVTKETATVLGGVTVTGSHIKKTDTETAQPVQTLTRKDLDRTGITTVGDILQTIPSAGTALNTTFNNGGTGATEVDLRNLGSNRVLVLVDGHRWIAGLRQTSTSSVDLNTIPLAIVDRIDVLQDGASAAYGSDAITGVVNIITKKRVEGINLSSHVGEYLQGDGLEQLHTLSGGHSFPSFFGGHTSFLGSFSFQDQRSVFAGDRDISKLPKVNTGLTRGSSFLPDGRLLFVASEQTAGMQNAAMNGRCPSLGGSVAQGAVDGIYQPGTVSPGMGVPPVSGPPLPGGYPTASVPGQAGMAPVGVNLCDLTHVAGANQDSQTADYRAFVSPVDAYNYAPINYLSTPLKTYNGFANLVHEFNDRNYLSFQVLHSERRSRQQLAPQPICVGNICPVQGGFMPGTFVSYNQASYISRNNPFNPFGQDIGRVDPNDPTNADDTCMGTGMNPDPSGTTTCGSAVGLVGQGAVLRRFVEAGPRIQEQRIPTQIGRASYNGGFDLFNIPMDFELGYSYGQSRETNRLFNSVNLLNLQRALGDGTCMDANGVAYPGCVPVNVLGAAGSITQDMLNYVTYTEYQTAKQKQSDVFFNFSSTIPLGKWLPGGPLGVAFGIERRTSHYTFTPAIEQITNVTGGLTSLPTDGAVTAKEAYLEFDIPLLKELPFIYGLEVSLAGRHSDYGNLGGSDDGKVGLKYKPFRDLLLRGTFSTSFRAPDAGELFLGNAGSYPPLVDPCVGDNGLRPAGGNVDRNCNTDMIPSSTTQTAAQISSPLAGNPNLKAENSHSTSLGFVFSPEYVPGFDFSMDYFKIILNNFISVPGGQFILDSCYGNDPNNRSLCQFVVRSQDGSNTLAQVNNVFANFPQTDTSGFDFQLNWALPTRNVSWLAPLGKFKLVTGATFLSSYNQSVPTSDGGQFKQGYAGTTNLPRWKINPSLQWSLGGFEASWNTRIIWQQYESCFDGFSPTLAELGVCSDPNHVGTDGFPAPRNRIKTAAKHDVQFGYGYKPYRARITFGVRNVLDSDPPVSYSTFANSFDPMYWVPGVLPYLNIAKDF